MGDRGGQLGQRLIRDTRGARLPPRSQGITFNMYRIEETLRLGTIGLEHRAVKPVTFIENVMDFMARSAGKSWRRTAAQRSLALRTTLGDGLVAPTGIAPGL